MTPSLRASAVRKARTMRSWLSPTAWWKWEVTPTRGQVLAHPLRVGVGDLAEQQLGADGHDLDPHGGQAAEPCRQPRRPRSGGTPAGRTTAVEVVLAAGEHGQDRGHPDGRVEQPPVAGQRRGQAHARWPCPGRSVLTLAELRAGMEIPCRPTTDR